MAVDGRQAALDNALKQIEKDFGKGAIMRLGEAADRMNVEVISSGSLAIDIAVGVGGFPRGRVIEAALQLSLMQSMRWILYMLATWV